MLLYRGLLVRLLFFITTPHHYCLLLELLFDRLQFDYHALQSRVFALEILDVKLVVLTVDAHPRGTAHRALPRGHDDGHATVRSVDSLHKPTCACTSGCRRVRRSGVGVRERKL